MKLEIAKTKCEEEITIKAFLRGKSNKHEFEVLDLIGYAEPDGAIYVNGYGVTRDDLERLRNAMNEVLEFIKEKT